MRKYNSIYSTPYLDVPDVNTEVDRTEKYSEEARRLEEDGNNNEYRRQAEARWHHRSVREGGEYCDGFSQWRDAGQE